MKDDTRLIRAGGDHGPLARTVNPPVQRASTVLLPDAKSLYAPGQSSYGRVGLSPRNALCDAIAEMEGAAGARLYPSGLSAMTGALLAVLQAGDDVLVCDNAYRPTHQFCDHLLTRFGVGVRYYPQTMPARAGCWPWRASTPASSCWRRRARSPSRCRTSPPSPPWPARAGS